MIIGNYPKGRRPAGPGEPGARRDTGVCEKKTYMYVCLSLSLSLSFSVSLSLSLYMKKKTGVCEHKKHSL